MWRRAALAGAMASCRIKSTSCVPHRPRAKPHKCIVHGFLGGAVGGWEKAGGKNTQPPPLARSRAPQSAELRSIIFFGPASDCAQLLQRRKAASSNSALVVAASCCATDATNSGRPRSTSSVQLASFSSFFFAIPRRRLRKQNGKVSWAMFFDHLVARSLSFAGLSRRGRVLGPKP